MGPLGRANIAEACAGLLGAKQRTALALIGITIGVASVSAMISVGTIVRAEAARQFLELGTDIVKVRLRAREQGPQRIAIDLADARGITALASIQAAAPYTIASARIVLEGTTTTPADVVGATTSILDLNRLALAEGRFVTRLDAHQYFATVGADIATELTAATGGKAVGATIALGNTVMTVIGRLGKSAVGQRAFDANKAVFIPIASARRITPKATLRDIVARMSPGSDYHQATSEVKDYFATRAPNARVQVRSAEELIEHLHRQMRLYTLLLGTVGGIALLVGGIGVMNVMLVAVTERKTEIGIRRALGARRRDIQAQFLAEAVILTLLGGAIGVALGVGATYAICHFSAWTFTVSAQGTALGAIVAASSGVFFGLYPAWHAAKLDPVVALQG